MIISIWIPLIVTAIAIFMWFSPFDLPGPIDELIVTAIAIGLWLAYFGELIISNLINSVLAGNLTSIMILGILLFVLSFIVRRR